MISLSFPLIAASTDETEPIRSEIFGVERLEQHARSLAEAHVTRREKRRGAPLLSRLEDNARVLRGCYRSLTEAVRRDEAIPPAAEWLIDNFFLVDDQVRLIRDSLPSDYYRELPKIAAGHLAGAPRVYGLTWAFVAHTDSRFDPHLIERFVRAYQERTPLTMGELWAVPIVLRLVLIENLRRISVQIVRARGARAEANALADRILETTGRDPDDILEVLEPYGAKPLDSPFAVALVQRLRESDPAVMPAMGWLEERLAETGVTSEETVRAEHMSQLAAHATIVNIFTSLRQVAAYDWREFFESVSLVERALRRDSTRIYAQMDFATRDMYRHAVEELARGSRRAELAVAESAIEMAALDAAEGDDAEVRRHLGFWLIRGGRRLFEKELGYRAPVSTWLRRGFLAAATAGYLGTIALVSALLVALLVVYLATLGVETVALVLLAILSLVPASDLAIALVQRDVSELLEPRRLPKLDFRSGIPESSSTLVAVPTMLTDEEGVHAQVERLEHHYLATARGHIAYAILSDWRDAERESLPEDERLLAAAAREIETLNARYGPRPDGGPRFLLLHRNRRWNPLEEAWMGWERKRGKIHELNRFLRGDRDTTFIVRGDGLTDVPAHVRYVLTLDADTRLPLEAAEKLVGALSHPLNRPRIDPARQRVVHGYGILQPRVTPLLPAADEVTLYHRIWSGPTGLDPYVAAVSDVYQDLFNEASYVGKGIYDVDAFETVLESRVPENTLLSHDLFEGSFARTGLVTDVEVFDEFPTHYETSARRVHRWARGDWQLLPWIVGRPPASNGRPPRSLSLISRWKMIDNLRRTLSPPSTFLLLVAGWAILPVSPLLWTAFVVATLAMPAAVPVLTGLVPRRRGIAKRSHLRSIGADAATAAAQVGLAVVFLVNRSVLMVDTIVRTLVRMLATRRHLLEWVTAAQAGRGVSRTLGQAYRAMWLSVTLALAVLALLLPFREAGVLEAVPILALWLAAPAVALWLSRPLRDPTLEELDPEATAALRRLARRTWRFFEELVGEDDGWLPPDNLQIDPEPVVAHRTSPTNIGMYLLSTVAAHDFGWIGTAGLATRIERTFETMHGLERHAGHLYNWYDTQTLQPLEPRYVSTVDSGNLAGHLLVVGQATRDLARRPILGGQARDGIGDAFALAREAARTPAGALRTGTVSRHDLDEALQFLAEALTEDPGTPADWASLLGRIEEAAATLTDVAEVLVEEHAAGAAELQAWSTRVADAAASHRQDLRAVAPWGEILAGDVPAWLMAEAERRQRWERALEALSVVPSPAAVNLIARTAETELTGLAETLRDSADLEVLAARGWLESVLGAVRRGRESAATLVDRLDGLAATAEMRVEETDFRLLYDRDRELFAIGYRPLEGRLDNGYYDLLATEARLASFVAIAKGDVPVEHWFRLGRPVTPVGRDAALISWSGSMFEYVMPYLVLKTPAGTLLDRTQRLVVRRQIQYGAERGIPWGVSESAYNGRDLALTYQYSHFGIPGLGLTRGLSEDLVVAPYATSLAAMIAPRDAVRNLERLVAQGAVGTYGLYEALDYTPIRLPKDQEFEIVRAYMAHHQGMTIAAIDNVVKDGILRERFHEVPMIGAAELLLQERVPRDVAVARPRPEEVKSVRHVREIVPPAIRRFRTPHTRAPRTHVLSNGRYSVMLTNAGSGYSRHLERAVTRWREDATRDGWGQWLYLRDTVSGEVWSACYQPTAVEPEHYEVLYSEDRAEIHRLDNAIWTSLEVIVAPEDDGELRRLTIKNLGARPREIEVTSYAELVLAPPAADDAHPAFQNLFVQTEFVPALDALVATRRPREGDDPEVWAAHVVAVEGGETVGTLQCETD
ncbi:MAG: glucoamylase family protein, partial [Gemmatimonadota bacterium]